VAGAGIVVEPRNADRLASAIRSVWSDDRLHARLAAAAARGARRGRRTWHDVARETRVVYAAAADAALGRGAGW
jgi:hypothetical protein